MFQWSTSITFPNLFDCLSVTLPCVLVCRPILVQPLPCRDTPHIDTSILISIIGAYPIFAESIQGIGRVVYGCITLFHNLHGHADSIFSHGCIMHTSRVTVQGKSLVCLICMKYRIIILIIIIISLGQILL